MNLTARGWLGLLSLNLIYALSAGSWILLIPFNRAPDEYAHFNYNVKFILQHHRLPVSGVDDLEAYAHTRTQTWGRAVSLYSYCIYPPVNYLVSAATAAVAKRAWNWPEWRGSRLASLGWGLLYLNALFAAIWMATGGNTPASLVVTAAAGLVPQVVYLAAYTNADIHSLAAAALLASTSIYAWRRPTRGPLALLGLATGLVLSAKYNYFLLLPAVPLLLMGIAHRERWAVRRFLGSSLFVGLVALAVSGFWFVRNAMLYGDPLGQRFAINLMAHYGNPLPPLPFTIKNLRGLMQLNFHGFTFESMIGRFDYLSVTLPPFCYRAAEIVLGAVAVGIPAVVAIRRDRLALAWLLPLVGLALASLTLTIYNTMVFDFQPQGRYLFPALVPLVLYCGWAASRHAAILRWMVLVAVLMVGLLFVSHRTLNDAYSQPVAEMPHS